MQMFEQISEGYAKIFVAKEKKISKDLPVFYNPEMKLNRDIAVLLLNAVDKFNLKIADILAGTGVRAVRFLKELKKDKIKEIIVNDAGKTAVQIIKKNLKLNKIKNCIKICNNEANKLLVESKTFDYIDIDPFGSPNPFLDNSIKKLNKDGILAVTATDTASLCGVSPKACRRKYWANPVYTEMMKEIGMRILVRKVQLVGAQYDTALTPIFCHATKHYFRVYFTAQTGADKVDRIIKMHKTMLFCSGCKQITSAQFQNNVCEMYKTHSKTEVGPLWMGELWDKSLVSAMKNLSNSKESEKLLEAISQEAEYQGIGFYDIYWLCSRLKKSLPKKQELIDRIRQKGFFASETHFSYRGIKSNISLEGLKSILKTNL